MAAKKKTSSRKPRTTRKSPAQAKAKAAAEALGNARTIIHVHGIGNKLPADVLKCQWDTALIGFDLGERSRLAYWVNRAYYPEPSKGSCATGDLVTSEDLNAVSSTSDLTARASSGATDLNFDWVVVERLVAKGGGSQRRRSGLPVDREVAVRDWDSKSARRHWPAQELCRVPHTYDPAGRRPMGSRPGSSMTRICTVETDAIDEAD